LREVVFDVQFKVLVEFVGKLSLASLFSAHVRDSKEPGT